MGDRPQVQFDVEDTGIGIAKELLPRLFQPFNQGDASMSRRFGGTGLGLAISKRLAEALGGTITVSSEPGAGSRFSLAVDAGPLDEEDTVDEATPGLSEQPLTCVTAEASAASLPILPLGTRVLLVEDGPDNQRLIQFLLTKAGVQVEVAVHGALGVEQALSAMTAGQPFDVVLMDMQMPVMDGYEATRRLRQVGYERPIIALTAHAMQGDRERCLAAGCDDFATKPIDRRGLLTTLAAYVTGGRIETCGAEPE